MRVLIFYLMKKINAATFRELFLVLSAIFFGLMVVIYLFFLRSEHLIYNNCQDNYRNLLLHRSDLEARLQMTVYDKVPKQSLVPQSIQDLQNDLVLVVSKSGIEHYELKLEGAELLLNQCCYRFSVNAKAQFRVILKFFRNLNKESLLLKNFTINNPTDNWLNFNVELYGFCGDYCVCKNSV